MTPPFSASPIELGLSGPCEPVRRWVASTSVEARFLKSSVTSLSVRGNGERASADGLALGVTTFDQPLWTGRE